MRAGPGKPASHGTASPPRHHRSLARTTTGSTRWALGTRTSWPHWRPSCRPAARIRTRARDDILAFTAVLAEQDDKWTDSRRYMGPENVRRIPKSGTAGHEREQLL
jgi:hypothetical protein